MTLTTSDDTDTDTSVGDIRRTLAQRIAHRNRQRAERMARMHSGSRNTVPFGVRSADAGVTSAPRKAPEIQEDIPVTRTLIHREFGPSRTEAGRADANAALNEFIDALQGGLSGAGASPAPAPEPVKTSAPVTPLCDLGQLTGAGPGLIWALQRKGISNLADMADLDPADLTDRLGILGRMIPAENWIRTARQATGRTLRAV